MFVFIFVNSVHHAVDQAIFSKNHLHLLAFRRFSVPPNQPAAARAEPDDALLVFVKMVDFAIR